MFLLQSCAIAGSAGNLVFRFLALQALNVLALALKLSLDGAAWPAKAAPEPAAWRQAAALLGQAVDVADLVQLIWDRPSP